MTVEATVSCQGDDTDGAAWRSSRIAPSVLFLARQEGIGIAAVAADTASKRKRFCASEAEGVTPQSSHKNVNRGRTRKPPRAIV